MSAPRPDPLPGRRKPATKYPWGKPGSTYVPGKAYQFSEEQRQKVKAFAAVGVPQTQIAMVLRIDEKTLRKHFREELEVGAAEANAQVGGRLFKLAMEGNPIACIFWMKARAGWVDRREVNHNHNIGPMMSHEERLEALGSDPDDAPRQLVDGTAEEVVDGDGPDRDDDAE